MQRPHTGGEAAASVVSGDGDRVDAWFHGEPELAEEEDRQQAATPEHWFDVGAVHAHVSLVDQQVRMLQAQVVETNRQLVQMSHCLQQLDMQVSMQKQQHQEDIVKIMATQAMTLSNLSMSQQGAPPRAKARPGPRERQRMKEKEEELTTDSGSASIEKYQQEPAVATRCVDKSKDLHAVETESELINMSQKEENEQPPQQKQHALEQMKLHERRVVPERRSEDYKDEVGAASSEGQLHRAIAPVPLSSWVSVMLFVLICGPKGWAVKDELLSLSGGTLLAQASLVATSFIQPFVGRIDGDDKAMLFNSTWYRTIQDVPVDEMMARAGQESKTDTDNAQITSRKMRELGHLRLSVSDCMGAEQWFSRALEQLSVEDSALANQSSYTSKSRAILQGDRGFALICAQRYQDGADVLEKVLHDRKFGIGVDSPHLFNALGYAHFKLNDYSRAKEVFAAVLKSHPENPVLWNNFGAASMSAGDIHTADDALYYAISKSSQLREFTQGYYRQVFSNNVHVLRRRSQDQNSAHFPVVEIFNCMVTEVRTMVASKGPEDFQQTYETVAKAHEALTDSPKLMQARSSILALEQEPLFCP